MVENPQEPVLLPRLRVDVTLRGSVVTISVAVTIRLVRSNHTKFGGQIDLVSFKIWWPKYLNRVIILVLYFIYETNLVECNGFLLKIPIVNQTYVREKCLSIYKKVTKKPIQPRLLSW